jgi:hypothetical protein
MEARWIVLAAVVILVVAVAAWMVARKQRRDQLRARFGPEYEHTVRRYGDVTKAESDLAARQERLRGLDIKPLSFAEAEQFAHEWRRTQGRFVDEPRQSIADADGLVRKVMHLRGYPVGEFDQRVEDISVDHPHVVEHYRAAHRIAVASASGEAGTEELRQAMVHYRVLFEDLLEVRDEAPRRMEAGR